MQAIEFEADIINYMIKIPKEYKELQSKHVKVIVLVEEDSANYDFSDLKNKLEWTGDELKEQRKIRNEW